jgi:hypothetical protein
MDICTGDLAVNVSPKLRRAQFESELARPNGGVKFNIFLQQTIYYIT